MPRHTPRHQPWHEEAWKDSEREIRRIGEVKSWAEREGGYVKGGNKDLVDELDVGDDLFRVERDLRVVTCLSASMARGRWKRGSTPAW